VKRIVLVLAVAVLAGCGGEQGGTATLWITRDRGAHVILQRNVPAGLTAMQALDRVAAIKTRYAGRFVQSIDGINGSITTQSDWFYFINGYEADRSAAEYRLRNGDVEWWDFRSWRTRMREPIVVGAFPEPFRTAMEAEPSRLVWSSHATRNAPPQNDWRGSSVAGRRGVGAPSRTGRSTRSFSYARRNLRSGRPAAPPRETPLCSRSLAIPKCCCEAFRSGGSTIR